MQLAPRIVGATLLAAQQSICLANPPADASSTISAPQLCTADGAFGVQFGAPSPAGTTHATGVQFDRGCVLFRPQTPHPLLSTYAACISEFDGKVYQIQAATVFDDQPPKGSSSLTAAQRKSNRERGQHALSELLKSISEPLRSQVVVNTSNRSWEAKVANGVTLEVTNFTEWSLGVDCRNEAMAMEVFRKRLQGLSRK